MDKDYWKSYYRTHKQLKQSPFAAFVLPYVESGAWSKVLFDVGCGSGRDALFFSEKLQGVHVVGIDHSESAVQGCLELAAAGSRTACSFITASFPEFDYDSVVPAGHKFSVYSRFTLHALSASEEETFLNNVLSNKNIEYLIIEARTTQDRLCGVGTYEGNNTYVTDHRRRFIDVPSLVSRLLPYFNFEHLSADTGYSPTPTDDPHLVRIVAKKR